MTRPDSTRGLRRIDLATPTPADTADFYRDLLGWTLVFTSETTVDAWVGDRLATTIRPPTDADAPGWTIAFAGTTASTLTAPTGTTAAVDTGRVQHGPWAPQPRPGEPCWITLATPDAATDDTFWPHTLGWTVQHTDQPNTALYLIDGRPVASRTPPTPTPTGPLPAGWICHFAVPNTAHATTRATELGGHILLAPGDGTDPTTAVITDPAGACCALVEHPAGWAGHTDTPG